MGTPKALLPYRGETFLEHLMNVMEHAQVGARRVVVGADADAILEAVKLPAEDVVVNADWEKGQLSSIQAAVRSLPAGTEGMLLGLIDHPFVSAGLVDALIKEFVSSGKPIVLPVYQGRRGHPVIFSASLYEELLAAPLETGARAVVWAHKNDVCEMATAEEGCILNLNDPEALARAREQVEGG